MGKRHVLQTSFQPAIVFLTLLFLHQCLPAQITAGRLDDFEDLTLNGWAEGGVSPNPPMIVATGGPDGLDDAFLRNVSSGVGTAGAKWVMFNQTSDWTGNYLAAGVIQLSMNIRNSGANPVDMRISFNGPGGGISSSMAFTVEPNNAWTHIAFPIDPQQFVVLTGGGNATSTLSAVSEFRILSNPDPDLNGETIAATVDVDNIRAEGISATHEGLATGDWTVFPNPAQNWIQLTHPDCDDPVQIRVYNQLGQLQRSESLMPPYDMDISNLPGGIYVVRINASAVLRFLH